MSDKNRIRYCIYLIIGIIVLLSCIYAIRAIEDFSINSDVASAFQNRSLNDSLRVFIKLKGNYYDSSVSIRGSPKIETNSGPKSEIINLIGKDKIKNDFGNTISAIITEDDFNKLRNNTEIESIELVGIKQIFLQESVGIINASLAWNLQASSINLTGKGQTVCIIDTGVNYTNPDLGGCFGNNSLANGCKIAGGIDYCANNDATCSGRDDLPEDLEGHGTHVSGIVAANGSISGVAPEAKIVMIKVCNSSGSCFDDAIRAGINWCVNNASLLNISVISLSLGSGAYASYCDFEDDPANITYAIGTAVAKNISVVVATGNDGYYNAISSPACMRNATPVGATTKSDIIASYSNTDAIVQLLAPGSSINSTYLNPTHEVLSGTSMATPHVAGAVAILNQYLKLVSISNKTQEIESILNSTGKQITDTGFSNLTFSRINIYSALFAVDVTPPVVNLVSPITNSLNETLNQTFICNATDWQLSNTTFYLWNSSDSLVYNETRNSRGIYNQTSFNYSNLQLGMDYKWNCLSYDLNNRYAFSSSNNTLILQGLSTSLVLPGNSNFTNSSFIDFTCASQTSTNYLLKNITFYLWNSTGTLIKNETKNIGGNTNSSTFNYTFTAEDNYQWNCLSYNNVTNSSWYNSNYSLTYDITSPVLETLSPYPESTSSNSITELFYFNFSDRSNLTCTLFLNDEANQAKNFSENQTQDFSTTLTPGVYEWTINCSDFAGNYNSTSKQSFTISAVSTLSPGGGGGGGSDTKTYSLSTNQIYGGYTQSLAAKDSIKFSFINSNKTTHSLNVNSIESTYVNLTIRSDPINLIIYSGQERKISVNSTDHYDTYIKINSISSSKVNLTIQAIYEQIKVETNSSKNNQTQNPKQTNSEPSPESQQSWISKGYIIILIVVIVLFVIIGAFTLKEFRKLPKSKSKTKK